MAGNRFSRTGPIEAANTLNQALSSFSNMLQIKQQREQENQQRQLQGVLASALVAAPDLTTYDKIAQNAVGILPPSVLFDAAEKIRKPLTKTYIDEQKLAAAERQARIDASKASKSASEATKKAAESPFSGFDPDKYTPQSWKQAQDAGDVSLLVPAVDESAKKDADFEKQLLQQINDSDVGVANSAIKELRKRNPEKFGYLALRTPPPNNMPEWQYDETPVQLPDGKVTRIGVIKQTIAKLNTQLASFDTPAVFAAKNALASDTQLEAAKTEMEANRKTAQEQLDYWQSILEEATRKISERGGESSDKRKKVEY